MNRFISYLKVILGIALTLNLSLSTALFADPPPPPAPCETEGCYWSLQQSVFSYLFGIEFVEGDPWAYRILDGNGDYVPITGTGQYSGKIHTEQDFSFDCTTYLPVSNDFSSLPPEQQPTPEQIQKMVDEGWQAASVAGTVTTALG